MQTEDHCKGQPPKLQSALSRGNAQAYRYLWVVATDIREQLVNEPAHQGSGGVNPRNELWYNLV